MRGLIVVKHAPLVQTKDAHSASFYLKGGVQWKSWCLIFLDVNLVHLNVF